MQGWQERSQYDKLRKTDGTKKLFKEIVTTETPPGILVYNGETAIGWIAIQPRENYPVLQNSRILKPIDENPVRSIEGYPVEPKKKTAPVFIYTGVASSFIKAGFEEAARRSETRPIMRKNI